MLEEGKNISKHISKGSEFVGALLPCIDNHLDTGVLEMEDSTARTFGISPGL